VDVLDSILTDGPGPRAAVEHGGELADRPLAEVGQRPHGGKRGTEGAARDRRLAGRGGKAGDDGVEVGCPRHQPSKVARVARDGGAGRLRPDEDLRVLALAALRRQRARDVHQDISLAGELTQADDPGGRRSGWIAKHQDERLASLVQMAEPDRLCAPVIREGTRRLTHEQYGVLDSGEGFVIE
jgi:hypothetical protein